MIKGLESIKISELSSRNIDENGMIKAGDLITTSSKAGYGMKCGKAIDCIGAVVGVAMQNQKENENLIMVMVK